MGFRVLGFMGFRVLGLGFRICRVRGVLGLGLRI